MLRTVAVCRICLCAWKRSGFTSQSSFRWLTCSIGRNSICSSCLMDVLRTTSHQEATPISLLAWSTRLHGSPVSAAPTSRCHDMNLKLARVRRGRSELSALGADEVSTIWRRSLSTLEPTIATADLLQHAEKYLYWGPMWREGLLEEGCM